MRLVTWYDDDGFLRQAYGRDDDPDEVVQETGVPHEPPDMREIDWDDVARELNELLIKRGLITWQDVQRKDAALVNTVKAVMQRRINALYRQKV